jgi:hypothetical protein
MARKVVAAVQQLWGRAGHGFARSAGEKVKRAKGFAG